MLPRSNYFFVEPQPDLPSASNDDSPQQCRKPLFEVRQQQWIQELDCGIAIPLHDFPIERDRKELFSKLERLAEQWCSSDIGQTTLLLFGTVKSSLQQLEISFQRQPLEQSHLQSLQRQPLEQSHLQSLQYRPLEQPQFLAVAAIQQQTGTHFPTTVTQVNTFPVPRCALMKVGGAWGQCGRTLRGPNRFAGWNPLPLYAMFNHSGRRPKAPPTFREEL